MKDIICAQKELDIISTLFVNFLCDLLSEIHIANINMVGIGNSISGGWTAINDNVCPQIEKLHPYLDEKIRNAGINLNLTSFALIGDNSNKKIYEFLSQNPSLSDVKSHFEEVFDFWKKRFSGTPFENYVKKEAAMQYYHDSSVRFKDFYNSNALTITSFNGCTGKFLDNYIRYLFEMLRNKWSFLEEEIEELKKIIQLITSLSEHSYITIGNIPYLSRNYLLFNDLINRVNQRIKRETNIDTRIAYFDQVEIEFINRFNGKIKLDNHPSLALQYETLSKYLLFLMIALPDIMPLPNKEALKDKYNKEISLLRKLKD